MWINQKNAVPDETQESVNTDQDQVRSGQIMYFIPIPKSKGFSQSLSMVLAGGDTISEYQISADGDKLR